jgi:glycosyltransferase involved in cell wall biosynthesis
MKVNFLLPHFGINPTGGFKIAYQYANYLAECKFNVNIIHASSSHEGIIKYAKYVKSYGEKIIKKNNWFLFHKNIKLSYVPTIDSRFIPDADITIATAWQTAKALELLPKEKGKKLYLIQHYEIWNGSKEEVDKTWRYTDMHKILISKWLINVGKEIGISNFTYIPNGVDFSRFNLTNNIENRDLIISMMYSDVNWKGAKEGLDALKIVRKKYPTIKVKFFGKCKKPYDLPEWIEYYENPKQQVLVNDIYNKSAIFICSSWSEGWGLPPMEAMACGCAVVTTDNGGVRDFAINNKTALICKIKDIKEMSNSLFKLLEDEKFRVKLATEGNKYVKNFTWEKSFAKFSEVILDYKI